jgi:phosphatidate phosphatase APP1
MTGPSEDARGHLAGRMEAWLHAKLERRLRKRGWRPSVVAYPGYGADGWVRILGRVHLVPAKVTGSDTEADRGWRPFFVPSMAEVAVSITVDGATHVVPSRRKGYLDVRLPSAAAAGWVTASLSVADAEPVHARVRIVSSEARIGVVSDVDDTIIVTMLPRPLVAFRNAFVRKSRDRRPVPGMAELFGEIIEAHPDAFVVYLSTGAWDTATGLNRFLARHGYPPGPLLMTHWGPTDEGWFRSGTKHKRDALRRLFVELPNLRWLLIGDDAQHDPSLYAEAADQEPAKVIAIAIRQLSAAEQVAHGTAGPADGAGLLRKELPGNPVCATDGFGLLVGLRSRRVLTG